MCRLFLLVVLLLTACASAPPHTQPVVRPAQAEQAPFVLHGRISVKHDGERTSATVRWMHQTREDEILLLAPFGQTMARIHRKELEVTLDTADEHYSAQDTGALMQRVLGWQLPLDGLRYWVLALPAPLSPASIQHDPDGRISTLAQDGWEIHYTRYAASGHDSLPLRLIVQRASLEIQLLIDEWEIQPLP
ncbi:MAG: lipoprotein insertase outer membrane protein LolB [Pseudomonadota bacterium]